MDPEDDFTPSMDIKLSRLNAASGAIDDDLDNGSLSPEHHQALKEQIEPQRQSLKAHKKAAIQRQFQEQQQMLMHQNAQASAMKQQDDEHEAQNFQGRVAVYTDPLTGQTAHLYKGDKGDWKEVTFDHAEKMKGGHNG